MPVYYDVRAAIVNESSTHIERLAARIIQLSGKVNDEFIKTFPFMSYPRNKTAFTMSKDDFYSYNKVNYLGISFVSYEYANYIKFASSFKLFPLNEGDQIDFYFEDDTHMEFPFRSNKSSLGFLNTNMHLITDEDLNFIANNKLKYWKLYNTRHNVSLIGGFVHEEQNKQYKSEKVGQKIFRLMAENIILTKQTIKQGYK